MAEGSTGVLSEVWWRFCIEIELGHWTRAHFTKAANHRLLDGGAVHVDRGMVVHDDTTEFWPIWGICYGVHDVFASSRRGVGQCGLSQL